MVIAVGTAATITAGATVATVDFQRASHPTRGEVERLMPDGPPPYWRGEIPSAILEPSPGRCLAE